MKPLLRTAIAALAAVFSFAAFAQDRVVRIGVLMPISGPGSYFGVMDKEGMELALEQFKNGVNGYKLQVQYEDSACSPLAATNTAKRILDQFKPHVVIGEECSDASLARAFRTPEWDKPNCRTICAGLTPALKAARTAFS